MSRVGLPQPRGFFTGPYFESQDRRGRSVVHSATDKLEEVLEEAKVLLLTCNSYRRWSLGGGVGGQVNRVDPGESCRPPSTSCRIASPRLRRRRCPSPSHWSVPRKAG